MVKIEEIKELINVLSDGNMSKAAKDIGISVSGLIRILNHQREPGVKTLLKIKEYLIENKIEATKYIFL